MKSHSQVLMIALAVSVAIVLALTVALVCISYIKEEPMQTRPAGTELTGEASTSPPKEETESTTDTEEATAAPEPPDLGNGLRFTSNGNGTCVISGIGTCTDACVVIPEYSPAGDLVTEIAAMAFYNCSTVTAVQIPASVRSIGSLAFAACSNLVYISVSASNPCYRDVDGVLYTADESTLILYPAMRTGSSAVIRSVTTQIADMAFYNCVYLSRVSFTGTAEQWENIRIGSKNYSLTAAAKTFGGAA